METCETNGNSTIHAHEQVYLPVKDRTPDKISITSDVTLPPGTKTWIPGNSSHRGLIVINPHVRLFSTHTGAANNGVAQVDDGTPFKLILAYFAKTEKPFTTGQTVSRASPHLTSLIASTFTTADVLRFTSDLTATTSKTTIKPVHLKYKITYLKRAMDFKCIDMMNQHLAEDKEYHIVKEYTPMTV